MAKQFLTFIRENTAWYLRKASHFLVASYLKQQKPCTLTFGNKLAKTRNGRLCPLSIRVPFYGDWALSTSFRSQFSGCIGDREDPSWKLSAWCCHLSRLAVSMGRAGRSHGRAQLVTSGGAVRNAAQSWGEAARHKTDPESARLSSRACRFSTYGAGHTDSALLLRTLSI